MISVVTPLASFAAKVPKACWSSAEKSSSEECGNSVERILRPVGVVWAVGSRSITSGRLRASPIDAGLREKAAQSESASPPISCAGSGGSPAQVPRSCSRSEESTPIETVSG